MPGFSETQEILDTNYWEAWRLIDEKSRTSKLNAAKLAKVVNRLMTAQDPNFDISQFHFGITAEEDQNAFFVKGEDTKDGRNLIAVSAGLIDTCANEDELAAIVGHELGHYTKSINLKGKKNTVFEEHGADAWAVKLLDDAGYDPTAMLSICRKVFGTGGDSNLLQSLLMAADVHGSPESRLEDISTVLTAVKRNKGEFVPQEKSPDWQEYQTLFNEAYRRDGYDTYLDQVFMKRFGHKDYAKIPFVDAVSLLAEEMAAGKIDNATRLNNMYAIIGKTDWEAYRTQLVADPKLTNPIQTLAENYAAHMLQKNNQKKLVDIFTQRDEHNNIANNLRHFAQFTVTGYLDKFGEFENLEHELKSFINAQTFEDAQEIVAASPLKNYHNQYTGIFSFSSFDFPKEDKAIGTTLPWQTHLSDWARRDRKIDDYMNMAFHLTNEQHYSGYGVMAPIPNRGKYDYYTDEKGMIIAVGKEARRLSDEDWNKKMDARHVREIQNNRESFLKSLDILNHFADWHNGKISLPEFNRYFKEHSPYEKMTDYMSYMIRYKEKDFLASDNLRDLLDSEAYKTFMAGDKFLTRIQERAGLLKEPDAELVSSLASANYNETFYRRFSEAFLKYSEASRRTPDENAPQYQRNRIGSSQKAKISLDYELYQYIPSSYNHRKIEGLVKDGKGERSLDELLEPAKTADQNIADFCLQQRHRIILAELDRQENANQVLYMAMLDRNYNIFHYIYDDLKKGKTPEYLLLAMNKVGIEPAGEKVSLLDNMKAVSKLTEGADAYQNPATNFNNIQAWNYIRQENAPAFDLSEFVKVSPPVSDIQGSSSTLSFDAYRDELAVFIDKHKLFPSGDFYKDLAIYEQMNLKKMFSAEAANKEKFLNRLTDELSKLSLPEQEKYAEALLSQRYQTVEGQINPEKVMPYPAAKMRLSKMWVNAVAARLGKDDGTPEYTAKSLEALKVFEEVLEIDQWNKRKALNKNDYNRIIRLFSDEVVSDRGLSLLLGEKNTAQASAKNMEDNDLYGRAFEVSLALLKNNSNLSKSIIEFLNTKLTPQSCQKLKDAVDKATGGRAKQTGINREYLEIMHSTFWSESLEMRAVFMNKLLNRYTPEIDKQIDYVCDMHFAKDDKYRKDAELIFKTVIKNFEPFEQGLILSAMASANENKDDEHQNASSSVGKGLTMFFENMGPAWVKFGQLLSYVPDLPSEIRDDLGQLKDKANISPRWEIFKNIDEALPAELSAKVAKVGKVLGAGSFWETVKIDYADSPNTSPEAKVLSLLRPNAAAKFNAGNKVILESIKQLSKADKKYQQLLKIAEQAGISGRLESDVNFGFQQLCKARKIYGGMEVAVDDINVKPKVADWLYYGTGRNGMCYKMMDLAEGESIMSQKHEAEDKKKMAKAYVTIELLNLLRGDVWDIDRHSGQQNFQKLSEDGFKKVIVGIFDTGAQIKNAPQKKDKAMLGELLYGMIRAARNGKDMNEYMFKKIKKLDRLNKLNIDTAYISEVQRGLTALSDIMEYQKEIKDKDGNITQERRCLDGKDMQDIATAIIDSGLVDKTVKQTLSLKVVLNKFRPFREGWASSLKEGLNKEENNPVSISFSPHYDESRGKQYNKPEVELKEIEANEKRNQTLGVDNKYIEHSNCHETQSSLVGGLLKQQRERA